VNPAEPAEICRNNCFIEIIQETLTLLGVSNLIRDETGEEPEGFFDRIGFEEL